MADITQTPQFEDYLTKVQAWLDAVALSCTDIAKNRDWCMLDMTKAPIEANLTAYFDRTKIADKYTEEYNKDTDAGPPYAFLQMESDLIYSMHKCFATRHRGRLMSYRDDCVQKNYRVNNALSLGGAKFAQVKDDAEKLVQWQS
jgi:hypothetical protein